jgi:hypothetical protein
MFATNISMLERAAVKTVIADGTVLFAHIHAERRSLAVMGENGPINGHFWHQGSDGEAVR